MLFSPTTKGDDMDATTRDAIIAAWFAGQVYELAGLNEHLAEYDPKAVEQMREAHAGLFAALDPQVQLCLLPGYTKVAYRTGHHNVGDKDSLGQVREGAWGPYDVANRFDRRITNTRGFETFTDLENPVTKLTVLTDEEFEAKRSEW
jgi:hypothetical protein